MFGKEIAKERKERAGEKERWMEEKKRWMEEKERWVKGSERYAELMDIRVQRTDSRFEVLESELRKGEFRRMAALRVNCLLGIIKKLYKEQSGNQGASDSSHSSNRASTAAGIIFAAREKYQKQYPKLDDSCFRLIRDYGKVG